MRIATSTVFDNQATQIDNLYATYQSQGAQLSSGKSLNVPSDDPTVIAQDLSVRADNVVQSQVSKNSTDLGNQLSAVDGALSSLTNVMQSARQLAVEGASDTIDAAQRSDIGTQVDQLLNEAIGIANTQYNGKYVFSGTNVPASIPLVQASGSPVNAVTSQGNVVQESEQLPNGTSVATGVTLQQAFNYNAPDGSPSVFQVLMTLRNSLQKGQVVDESQHALNLSGTAITSTTTFTQLSTGAVPQVMATPLQPDSSGQYSMNIASGTNTNGVTITFTGATTIAGMLAAINAQTASTGVSATFNYQTQRFSLASATNPPGPFEVQDVPSAGATNSSNVLAAFNLVQNASTTSYLSTQLGDVDKVIQTAVNARAVVGSNLQTAQSIGKTADSQALNDTAVQSGLEDADIAKVTSEFSKTQTVLQAAYATTSRLEAKTLFDYL